MNKEIYEKILFIDKILNATVNPRSYRYFSDIKKYILECDDKNENLQKEIERLNNIINELEKALNVNVELNYVHNGKRQYNKTLTEGGLLYRDYIKSKLQELKGDDK